MKRNMFNEAILQPGDDIAAHFAETFDTEGTITARFIDDDSESDLGWTACLMDDDGNEVQIHDFASREELIEALAAQNVEIDEDAV